MGGTAKAALSLQNNAAFARLGQGQLIVVPTACRLYRDDVVAHSITAGNERQLLFTVIVCSKDANTFQRIGSGVAIDIQRKLIIGIRYIHIRKTQTGNGSGCHIGQIERMRSVSAYACSIDAEQGCPGTRDMFVVPAARLEESAFICTEVLIPREQCHCRTIRMEVEHLTETAYFRITVGRYSNTVFGVRNKAAEGDLLHIHHCALIGGCIRHIERFGFTINHRIGFSGISKIRPGKCSTLFRDCLDSQFNRSRTFRHCNEMHNRPFTTASSTHVIPIIGIRRKVADCLLIMVHCSRRDSGEVL